jgi:predicted NodU family carbamoyl transferase
MTARNQKYFMGINGFPADQTGACIIEWNDSLGVTNVVSISEERLSRIKNDCRFPWLSIRACLDHFGLKDVKEIEKIAYDTVYENPVNSPLPKSVSSEYLIEIDSRATN